MPHLSAKNRVDSKLFQQNKCVCFWLLFFGDFPKNFQVGASKGWFPIMESAFPATYFCSFHVPFFWAMCFGGPRTTFLKSHAGAKTCWPSSRRISNRRRWFFFWFSNARGFKVIWRMDPYHGLGWTRMFLGFFGNLLSIEFGSICSLPFSWERYLTQDWKVSHQTFLEFFIPTCPGVYKNTHRIERTVLFRCNLSCYRVYPFTSCLMVDRRMIKSLVEVGHGVPTK